MEDGLVSVPCSEPELRGSYPPRVLLNTLGAEIKDPARPDIRTLVDANRGGVGQHIHLTMQPTWPSRADSLRILNRLNDHAEAKFDGCSAHRMALTPKPGRGMVSIVGPNGLLYANAVGAFGSVSAGRNWGLLASSPHRWALMLVGGNEFLLLLFSDDALVLAENEICGESF